MGVITYDVDVPSPVSAAKMYQSFIVDGDTLIPKALPLAIKSVEILQGDGGVGSVKLITFVEENQLAKSVKHNIYALDKEKSTYGYTITEGEFITGGIETISYLMEIVPSDDGGCIVKNKTTFTINGDATIPEEEIKLGKERIFGLCKAVEAYILANP